MEPLKVSWDEIKSILASKPQLRVQWYDIKDHYYIYLVDGAFTILTTLSQKDPSHAADITDFEDNYKADGNQPIGTSIRGRDGVYTADVIFEDGLYKLATDKKVQVESLAGVQLTAANFFGWDGVSDGDTLTLEIDATDSTPFFSRTFTVNVGETDVQFAQRVALELNQDFVDFQPNFRAVQVKDNSILWIESKFVGETGENDTIDSFRVTGTGTITATLYRNWDDFIRRTSTIQASKSSVDPRVGIFGIEGTVESRSADVSGLFVLQPYRNNTPTQIQMNINAATTDQVFTFPMDALDDLFISEIRFFGLGNGIQFQNFLSLNSPITDGILIQIKTDNNLVTFPVIRRTEDFADKFAFGGGDNFQLYIQSGADKFLASFLSAPFPLRRSGTFGPGNDDYIRIIIRDNLSQITQLQAAIVGVRREA